MDCRCARLNYVTNSLALRTVFILVSPLIRHILTREATVRWEMLKVHRSASIIRMTIHELGWYSQPIANSRRPIHSRSFALMLLFATTLKTIRVDTVFLLLLSNNIYRIRSIQEVMCIIAALEIKRSVGSWADHEDVLLSTAWLNTQSK